MSVGEICTRKVVCAAGEASAEEAAKLMRNSNVGAVVVVDETSKGRIPKGILTDRDIVVKAIAAGLDPCKVPVIDLMSPELFTIDEHSGAYEALEKMRRHGIQRLPVVNPAGYLCGIVSSGELISLLTMHLGQLKGANDREHRRETAASPASRRVSKSAPPC